MSDAVRIVDLSYCYRHQWTGSRICSLHPFSLSITEGEVFGFLGHNGAGKTTTIKNILRLITPSTGSIEIFGCDNRDPKSRQPIGYVPEHPYFYDYLRVNEAIRMGAELAGLPRREIKSRVSETIERVGLSARSSAPLRTLSKGLVQRVAIAQALVAYPRLLILDEPFSGLDPLGRREMCGLFDQERRRGTTIFMASHILSDVEYLCDRVSIMAGGELKGVFSLADIPRQSQSGAHLVIESPRESDAAWEQFRCSRHRQGALLDLSFSEEEHARNALQECLRLGYRVCSFEVAHGNLENLYLSLVDTKMAREQR